MHLKMLTLILIISNVVVNAFHHTKFVQPVKDLSEWISTNCNPSVKNIRVICENECESELLSDDAANLWHSFTVITGKSAKQKDFSQVASIVLIILDKMNINIHGGMNGFPSNSSLFKWTKEYANQKRDHFVFIGKTEEVEMTWNDPSLNTLKWKWGYILDSRIIFTPIQPTDHPLLPTTFRDVVSLNTFYKPEMFAMGHNLRGRSFHISGWTKGSPYFLVSTVHPNGDREYDGTMYRIFNETYQKFNFTNIIFPVDDDTYASHLPNGTWTGIVGNLLYEERHFDISMYLSPQTLWYDFFDFSNTVTSLKVNFVTVQPIAEVQWQAFLHPFNFTVWIFLLVVWIVMTTCMCIFTRSFRLNTYYSFSSFWFNSFIATYKIALEQNTKILPGGKLLACVWLFAIIITGTTYKTEIISALTFPSSVKLPKTHSELVARSDYHVVINAVGEVEAALFQTSESPAIQALSKRAIYTGSQSECIKSIIEQPKTVCFAWCPMLPFAAAETAITDLQVDPFVVSYDAVVSADLAVGYKKNSPYYAGFSYIINSVYESGLYNLWHEDIYSKQRKKGFNVYKNSAKSHMLKKLKSITDLLRGNTGVMKPLKTNHLKMTFCLEIIGLALGLIVFGCECWKKILHFSKVVLRDKSKTKTVIILKDDNFEQLFTIRPPAPRLFQRTDMQRFRAHW